MLAHFTFFKFYFKRMKRFSLKLTFIRIFFFVGTAIRCPRTTRSILREKRRTDGLTRFVISYIFSFQFFFFRFYFWFVRLTNLPFRKIVMRLQTKSDVCTYAYYLFIFCGNILSKQFIFGTKRSARLVKIIKNTISPTQWES